MEEYGLVSAVAVSPSLRTHEHMTAARLQTLFEHSPVAIVALDAEHRFVMCNPAFETLFQFSRQELLVTDLDELITEPEITDEARSLSMAVLAGEKVHTVARRRRKDGMMVDVEIYGIPLIVGGELTGVYGVYQDVTERNHAKRAYRHLTNMLETLQQEERRRIARDLHDSTSQELAVLNWNLTLLMRMVGDKDETLQALVSQTKEIAMQCSAHIRSASYLLHPPMLGDEGLLPVVSRLAREFEHRSGIRITLDIPSDLGRFPDVVEITIFRVLQEALANVLRHSGSPVAHLSLQQMENWLKLVVSDEGKHPVEKVEYVGVGVSGMRERLHQLGGYLQIVSAHEGTTLSAALPIEQEAHA